MAHRALQEWVEQSVHKEIGEAVAKIYRESRAEGGPWPQLSLRMMFAVYLKLKMGKYYAILYVQRLQYAMILPGTQTHMKLLNSSSGHWQVMMTSLQCWPSCPSDSRPSVATFVRDSRGLAPGSQSNQKSIENMAPPQEIETERLHPNQLDQFWDRLFLHLLKLPSCAPSPLPPAKSGMAHRPTKGPPGSLSENRAPTSSPKSTGQSSCSLLNLPLSWPLLQDMWRSAGFGDAFEGPVDVANRVAELLMLRQGAWEPTRHMEIHGFPQGASRS